MTQRRVEHSTVSPVPSARAFLVAALAFASLVVAMPALAYLFRDPINGGGWLSLVTLVSLSLGSLVLSAGCLALFARGHRRAMRPPDHARGWDSSTDDQRRLMKAFGFDADDLDANRAGRLSERQRANLRAHRQMMGIMLGLMLGVIYLSVGLIPVVLGPLPAGASATTSGDDAGLIMGIGLINALVLLSCLYTYWLLRDQIHARLSVVEGVAGPAPATSRVPSLGIGPVAIPVIGAEQTSALAEGARYRVCFIRGPAPIVLSIEPA